MVDPNSNYGPGFDANGVDFDRNDYNAENPEAPSDEYDEHVRQAERVEDNEWRDIYPGDYEDEQSRLEKQTKALKRAVGMLRETNARLDEILKEIEDQSVTQDEPSISAQEIGSKVAGVASVKSGDLRDKSGGTKSQVFVDSKGMIHNTLEDLREAEEGYR